VRRRLLPPVHEGGDRLAVRIDGRELTYGELRSAAAALSERLRGAERAAVWAEPTLETAVAVVAATSVGVPLVPVNPKLGSGELQHVLDDSAPDVVLGRDEPIDVDARAGDFAGEEPDDDEAPALVVYTSGTTGPPKGALLSRRAVATNIDALASAWDWSGDDRLTHGLPVFHVHGLVLGLFGPLRLGGQLDHVGRFDSARIAAALKDGATMMFGVPTMYGRLADQAAEDSELAGALGRARLVVSGSAPLPAPVFERFAEATGQRIVERYGLTETLMNTAVRADGERRPGYVGLPLDGVELRLVDDGGADVEASDDETIGEVAVRGPNLFSGYLNRPDATDEAMRDGWFFTGDLGTRSEDGYLRIVGRRSTDLIKTGGYKVGAGEVEVALLEHPAVAEAAVTGAPDEDLGERIIAWVATKDGESAESDELIDHVAGLLAPHKRPREVRFVEELPRNAMGKIVKQQLEA
jgi:malonyl-CoA/methylmalonyl-CoA synthetase